MFLDLFDKVKEKMNQGYDLRRKMKRHKLSRMMRLLLVLTWLRKYPNLVDLKDKFDVSESTSKREVDFLLSILVENLNIIKWPEVPEKDWESCVGSPHYKNRTHPKQADYYRGDKHAFFINSQVVVSPKGQLLEVVLGKGRNNDQSMFKQSGLIHRLITNDFKLLGDGGYHHRLIVTPDTNE